MGSSKRPSQKQSPTPSTLIPSLRHISAIKIEPHMNPEAVCLRMSPAGSTCQDRGFVVVMWPQYYDDLIRCGWKGDYWSMWLILMVGLGGRILCYLNMYEVGGTAGGEFVG